MDDGDPVFEGNPLERGGECAPDESRVLGAAFDDDAQGQDCVVPSEARHFLDHEGNLECTGHLPVLHRGSGRGGVDFPLGVFHQTLDVNRVVSARHNGEPALVSGAGRTMGKCGGHWAENQSERAGRRAQQVSQAGVCLGDAERGSPPGAAAESVYSKCPILTRLVSRYRALCGLAGALIGTTSTIFRPNASSPTTFLGLLVRNRIFLTPRSTRIWAPMP